MKDPDFTVWKTGNQVLKGFFRSALGIDSHRHANGVPRPVSELMQRITNVLSSRPLGERNCGSESIPLGIRQMCRQEISKASEAKRLMYEFQSCRQLPRLAETQGYQLSGSLEGVGRCVTQNPVSRVLASLCVSATILNGSTTAAAEPTCGICTLVAPGASVWSGRGLAPGVCVTGAGFVQSGAGIPMGGSVVCGRACTLVCGESGRS